MLDATGEAMVLVSPERVLLSVNRRFEEFFQVEAHRVVGRTFDEVGDHVRRVYADAPDFFAKIRGTAADRERQFTAVLMQQWPQMRELQMFSTPVHSGSGEHLGRLYTFRDITREREVDRMKTEFVSMVSHELRTPLTSIKGYIDLLLDGDVGEISEDQREFLVIVKNNADRLVALINDLLDISRIEAGRIDLHRVPLDLGRLVRDVASMLRPQIEAKGQVLTLELPESMPFAFGDQARAIQVLTNLLSNAHKYTPAGGSIFVVARAETSRVWVDVRDTGIGLTPEEQGQIFTKFFRARNRVTQEVGGTGLGLAICKSLVEMQGGEMGLKSIAGEGSTFSFSLPLAETDAEASPSAPSPISSRTGGRILVVEDEPDIANLIERYLARSGYAVIRAVNGAEALRAARAEQPDLITLDILLPDADGFTVLEWLKSDRETARIPVVVVSIVADDGRGRGLGAVDYLTKPVQEPLLLQRVRDALSGGQTGTILVVDDELNVRQLIAGHLRRAGYRVVEAENGQEAVERAREALPALILMDLRMPVMDGVAALRALRSNTATQDVQVMMMTASPGALEANRAEVEDLGGTMLLEKPATAEELAAVVGRVLTSNG